MFGSFRDFLDGNPEAGSGLMRSSYLIVAQGGLHDAIRRFLADPQRQACATHRTVDGGHGRIETRTSLVCADIGWLQAQHAWPGLSAIGQAPSVPR